MHHIAHTVRSQISTDGSLGSCGRIGWAEKIAYALNYILALKNHRQYGAGTHKLCDLRKEWEVRHMGVVLAKQCIVQLDHPGCGDGIAFIFKPGDYLSSHSVLQAVWFKKY